LPASKARQGGQKTEKSAHAETHRRIAGPTAKENANNEWVPCNIRQVLIIYRGNLSRGYGGVEDRRNSPPAPRRAAGGHVIAQDEPTSVVWGMPGQVATAGLCSAVLPINEIAPRLTRLFGDRP